jgi:UDP-N-acetylmuramyl pentapeptide synthase
VYLPRGLDKALQRMPMFAGYAVPPKDTDMVSSEHFRQELRAQLGRAATDGKIDVLINSGELSRSVSNAGYSFPACCEAMQEEFKQGDTLLLDRSNGAGMTVRYLLPRTIGIQFSEP